MAVCLGSARAQQQRSEQQTSGTHLRHPTSDPSAAGIGGGRNHERDVEREGYRPGVQSAAAISPLIITADDTTGALESAGAAADAGWDTTVVSHAEFVAHGPVAGGEATNMACVVDLRSRHATADEAAARLRSVLAATVVRVHKIDSTLRGNWPAEVASATATGRRVLMVPSYPAAGRICQSGVVTEHGVPVERTQHADDPRAPARTSRPARALHVADELTSPGAVAEWLQHGGECAVADAVDDRQLRFVVELACARDDVLLVGTAAVVGAVAEVLRTRRPGWSPTQPIARRIVGPVLVVCGSLHPISRAQIRSLIQAGAVSAGDVLPGSAAAVVVLVSSSHRRNDPTQVAAQLAATASGLIRSLRPSTLVLVGGDTAEAFIGDRSVHVAGSLGIGVAIGTIDIDGATLTVVAKPGAFGSTNTLVDLMSDALTDGPRP